jgi:NADPH2:quinone reductase
MRAVVIARSGGPEVLQVAERPEPRPAPGEVLVRVHAAGINRADVLQRLGRYPPPPGVPAEVPGLEYAGVIEAVEAPAAPWRPGDRVMGVVGGGAYAERLTTPAAHAIPIPAAWSFRQAAAVPEAFLTAFDALSVQGGLAANRRVLIHAVGSGVGIAALQLAKMAGAIVAGTSRSKWKLERASQFALDQPVLVSGAFDPGAALAGWADIVLDLVGAPYLAGNLQAVSPQGRILVVGLMGGREGPLNKGALLGKRVSLIGTVLRSGSADEKADLVRAFSQDVLPAFDDGRLQPVLDRSFPFADAAGAHRHVEENRNFGSVVIDVDGD